MMSAPPPAWPPAASWFRCPAPKRRFAWRWKDCCFGARAPRATGRTSETPMRNSGICRIAGFRILGWKASLCALQILKIAKILIPNRMMRPFNPRFRSKRRGSGWRGASGRSHAPSASPSSSARRDASRRRHHARDLRAAVRPVGDGRLRRDRRRHRRRHVRASARLADRRAHLHRPDARTTRSRPAPAPRSRPARRCRTAPTRS